MLKLTFSLGQRITLAIAGAVVGLILLILASWWGISSITGAFDAYDGSVNETSVSYRLESSMLKLQSNMNAFLSSGEDALVSEYKQQVTDLESLFAEAADEINDNDRLSMLHQAADAFKKYDTAAQEVHQLRKNSDSQAADVLVPNGSELSTLLDGILQADRDAGDINGAFTTSSALQSLYEGLYSLNQFLLNNDPSSAQVASDSLQNMSDLAKAMEATMAEMAAFDESFKNPEKEASLQRIQALHDTFQQTLAVILEERTRMAQLVSSDLNVLAPQVQSSLSALNGNLAKWQDGLRASAESTQAKSLVTLGILGVLSISISTILAFVIVRGVSRQIHSVADRLRHSADETKVAADQMASSSDELSNGASDQAGKLEETSSSMEEFSSMVAHNNEAAQLTSDGANQADEAANRGVQEMTRLKKMGSEMGESAENMLTAMDSIKQSSDAISKIIKTIDEIAFQTNILALNAAVEAARAGDAGLGFAVVAEEVRGLARRCADAASETTSLIEDSIQRSEHGVAVSKTVQESLSNVMDSASSVDTVLVDILRQIDNFSQAMSQIVQSTGDQKLGIDEINNSISDMNAITQQNAASAEETAAVSHALRTQSDDLGKAVDELHQIISGNVEKKQETKVQNGTNGGMLKPHKIPMPKVKQNGRHHQEKTFAIPGR